MTKDNAIPSDQRGELLYNGIRLPAQWPPRAVDRSGPRSAPYLSDPQDRLFKMWYMAGWFSAIHIMTPKIDEGPILSQRAYAVESNDTVFRASQRVYANLPDQIDEALAVLEGPLAPVPVQPRPEPSYYSTPTIDNGGRSETMGAV